MKSTDFIKLHALHTLLPCYLPVWRIIFIEQVPGGLFVRQHTVIETSDGKRILVFETPAEVMGLIKATTTND